MPETETVCGIESEYDVDRNSSDKFELRVEVLGTSDLHDPEYRLGDKTASFTAGNLLRNVYVELKLGKKPFCTACAENAQGERSVGFDGERALFAFGGEQELEVSCSVKRGLRAVLRGDPLIGTGSLKLEHDLCDGMPRWADVLLYRGRPNVVTGSVSLQYQLLHLNGGGVVACPSSISSERMPVPPHSSNEAGQNSSLPPQWPDLEDEPDPNVLAGPVLHTQGSGSEPPQLTLCLAEELTPAITERDDAAMTSDVRLDGRADPPKPPRTQDDDSNNCVSTGAPLDVACTSPGAQPYVAGTCAERCKCVTM